MFTYVLRRLLLMIPTTFGISMILWILMVSAPGRPGSKGSFGGEKDAGADPTKELGKDETQALFRRQYGLDRPVFWNDWLDLRDDAVLEAVELARASAAEKKAADIQTATERLEDWGSFAVPPLVRLLARTTGETQESVLFWLRRNATWRIFPTEDPKELEENRRRTEENFEVSRLKWPANATPAQRAETVARWQAWFEKNRGRWDAGTFARVRTSLFDTQFGTYWANLLRFEFGKSHQYKRPVLGIIAERLPVTMTLALLSALIVYLLSVPIGIFSAVRAGTPFDRGLSLFLFFLYSLPSFFVGTILLRLTTVGDPWSWFPTSGFAASDAKDWSTADRFTDVLWHLTLPLVTLTYGGLAAISRYARTGMLDVLRADYVRTARAKGLSEGDVILRHAARNGMMPIVTLIGGILPGLVGGSVLVEFIFNMKGMGLLTIEAIQNRDYNVIVAETLIVAILTQFGILLSDVLYAVVDPRIQYK